MQLWSALTQLCVLVTAKCGLLDPSLLQAPPAQPEPRAATAKDRQLQGYLPLRAAQDRVDFAARPSPDEDVRLWLPNALVSEAESWQYSLSRTVHVPLPEHILTEDLTLYPGTWRQRSSPQGTCSCVAFVCLCEGLGDAAHLCYDAGTAGRSGRQPAGNGAPMQLHSSLVLLRAFLTFSPTWLRTCATTQARLHLRHLVCSLSALAGSLGELEPTSAAEGDFIAAAQLMTASQDMDGPQQNGARPDPAEAAGDPLDLMDLVGLTQDAPVSLADRGADEEVRVSGCPGAESWSAYRLHLGREARQPCLH